MGSWAIFREPAVLGGWPSCCVRPPDFLASSSGRALYPVPTTRYWTVSSRPCRIPWMGRPTVKPARVGLELVSVEPRHPKPYPSSNTQVVGHGRGAATCRGAARSGGPSGRRVRAERVEFRPPSAPGGDPIPDGGPDPVGQDSALRRRATHEPPSRRAPRRAVPVPARRQTASTPEETAAQKFSIQRTSAQVSRGTIIAS